MLAFQKEKQHLQLCVHSCVRVMKLCSKSGEVVLWFLNFGVKRVWVVNFVTIFEVNLEEYPSLAVKNSEASFVFLARLLLSLR